MNDLIRRQDAIDVICGNCSMGKASGRCTDDFCPDVRRLQEVPSADPTIYGYNIEHLAIIAGVLKKENLPPERVAEILTDIARIVTVIVGEYEEVLKKIVEEALGKVVDNGTL